MEETEPLQAVKPHGQSGNIRMDTYGLGLALLALSAFIFYVSMFAGADREGAAFGLFGLNFVITITYLIAGKKIFTGGAEHTRDRFVFLMLALVSAYSLNREIPVFEQSVMWLGILLPVIGITYLAVPHMERLPAVLRQTIMFVVGIAVLLWLYLSLYLMPLYGLSIVAALGLGFSLHTFVPLLLLIFTLAWIVYKLKQERRLAIGFSLGVVAALSVAGLFSMQWAGLDKIAARDYQRSLIDDNNDLPSWVKVARHLPDSWVTGRFLKGDIVYSTFHTYDVGFWEMPSMNLAEVRKHDPLVMIASMFDASHALDKEDRIKILEAKYDARHKTEERLWSGKDLRTTDVITNANIWPSLHLAYTEQIITVANQENRHSWRREEEAIYSFHLPEGSAVTSLSLWIDGKESKGILTTKGKADSAYKQIVGKERRDPSVVHWAEGNRISVRVFPVMAGEYRVFKIGVTSPLIQRNGKLSYQPVKFEGPPANGARSTTQLSIEGTLSNVKGLGDFDKDERGRYKHEGGFDDGWNMSFDAPPLKPAVFSFNGNTYSMQPYAPQRVAAAMDAIYLDLNKSWTKSEYNAVCDLAKGRKLFACTDDVVEVNDENRDAVFKAGQASDFSLFPLFHIAKPETSLIISKSTERSPNVKDLEESAFAAKLDSGLKGDTQFLLFNIGTTLSPFLKTLKEHRLFRYEQGRIDDLRGLLSQNVFAAFPETDSSIVIDDAGMRITKIARATGATGPDHLQRLFAYNHMLQHLGKRLYTNMEGDAALVKEASEAYVVTPISSLVVLETAEDYKRFGIKDDAASLKNASVKSHGAVPEPHEWALIVLALCMLAWVRFRRHPLLLKVVRR